MPRMSGESRSRNVDVPTPWDLKAGRANPTEFRARARAPFWRHAGGRPRQFGATAVRGVGHGRPPAGLLPPAGPFLALKGARRAKSG